MEQLISKHCAVRNRREREMEERKAKPEDHCGRLTHRSRQSNQIRDRIERDVDL
jgi:hypothetical protein